MRKARMLAALALAVAAVAPSAAQAQYRYHHWNAWHGRVVVRPGWYGPAWYGRPGPHYGWYRWHAGFYRHCGWRVGPYGRRFWRCY